MILKYLEYGQQFQHLETGVLYMVVQMYTEQIVVEDQAGVRTEVPRAEFFNHNSVFRHIPEKKCA